MIILSHFLASTGADGPVPLTLHIVHSPWSATIPPSAKQGEPTLPHSLRQIIFMVSLLALYIFSTDTDNRYDTDAEKYRSRPESFAYPEIMLLFQRKKKCGSGS